MNITVLEVSQTNCYSVLATLIIISDTNVLEHHSNVDGVLYQLDTPKSNERQSEGERFIAINLSHHNKIFYRYLSIKLTDVD